MFNFNRFKNNIAIIDGNSSYLYKDVICKINVIKKKLGKLENKIVLLIANNSSEFIFFYIYLLKAGAKIILLNNQIDKKYFENVKKEFRPNYIIKPKNLNKIHINEKINKKIFNFEIYKTNFKILKKINKKIAILLSTSGSTGSSKFVMLSLENLKSNTIKISNYLNIKTTDRAIITLPFSYSYGLSIINSHLFSGSSIVITDKSIIEKSFWDSILFNKVNCLYGVPFIFNVLKRFLNKNYFSKFKFLANAGGKLDLETSKKFTKKSIKDNFIFYNMYGQTEASPRMSYINLTKYKKYESIGKPIKSGKFFLLNQKKSYIKKANTIGELVYEGKNVMIDYAYKITDLKKIRQNKFRLFTGDLAYCDKNKFFYITGRKNRFIKINGIRIDLDQIEHSLKNNYKNILCSGKDQLLKIFIVRKNLNLDFNILKKKVSRKFGVSITNIAIYYIKSIPINKNGKVDYMLLNKSK